MICLYLRAPFAAFREFSAGYYRKTAPFIPPSAAYGLLLNLAGIDSRRPMPLGTTEMREDLPDLWIALGAVRLPRVQSLLQQIHNWPVRRVEEEEVERVKGTKPNIQPVRRELLADVEAYICARGEPALEAAIRDGLRLGSRRPAASGRCYGLPFLGDNNFLIDVLQEVAEPGPAHWWVHWPGASRSEGHPAALMTVWVHRTDSAQTVRVPLAPLPEAQREIPPEAWVLTGPGARRGREGASSGSP